MGSPEKIIELLSSICEKPGMYAINKVEDIQFVVFGLTFCESSTDSLSANELNIKFRDFVNKSFDIPGDHDWARLIRFHSAGDSHSIKLFSTLFSRFLEQEA